jgi:hypothetical protein
VWQQRRHRPVVEAVAVVEAEQEDGSNFGRPTCFLELMINNKKLIKKQILMGFY